MEGVGRVRAVAYLRVSTEEQAADDRVSLEVQERDIRGYCERRGYELVHTYCDPGYHGDTANRPAFRRLCEDIPKEAFNIIVIWRGDRICRGFRPYVVLQDALEGVDIEIEASNDVVNRRWLAMKAFMAGEELEAIKERCRMGARERAASGRITGTVRYGYRIGNDGKPEIVEAEAEIVRRIYQMYLSGGISCERIAKVLNDEGVPTRKGMWYSSLVKAILSDSCYAGEGRWGLRKHYRKDDGNGRDKHMTRWTPESDWLTIPYPPIIDDNAYRSARSRRHNQTRVKLGKVSSADYPLKGILWCEQHQKLYTTHYCSRKGHVNRYYQCLSGARYSDRCGACARPRFNADHLESEVFDWLYRLLSDPEYLEELKDGYMRRLRDGGGMELLAKARKQLDALEEEAKRVLITFEKGHRDEAEMELRMKSIREQREFYQEELQGIEAAYGDLEAQVQALEALGAKGQVEAAWKNVTRKGRDFLLRTQLRRLTVTERGGSSKLLFVVKNECVAALCEPVEWCGLHRSVLGSRCSGPPLARPEKMRSL
jgi:site-specific DNA recombinase